ncbi:MAG TPA: hypothetical protein VMT03_24905 [Polyangia bacterium]|nr:hypothetical protein [Polyangia bacterium]
MRRLWCAALLLASAATPVARGAEAVEPGFVGSPGTDADGYPRATADKRVPLRLLRARKLDSLEAWMNDLQAQFEADSHKEYWPMDALDAFGNPDPTLNDLLDEWVAAKPDSYMALAARGIHRESLGWYARGGKWACDTPPENFSRMLQQHAVAFPDLDDALAMHPALLAVHRALIRIASANSAPVALRRRLLDKALEECPDCYQVRVAFILTLRPRWGGTYAAMDAFAAESARRSANPRMRTLGGYADEDRCNLLRRVPAQRDAALQTCNRALSFGETVTGLLERGRLLEKTDPAAALADANRALALRPQDTDALALQARLLGRRRDYAGQGRDLALLRELDPVRKVSKAGLAWAAQGLAADAGQARRDGRTGDQITALERAIALEPDNLDNHLRLDDAFVQAGQLQRIPPMWRSYLKRHPRDARAHLELAGALHHLGREPEALTEADAACQLGERTGCAIARTSPQRR